jgi:hypothetical protein
VASSQDKRETLQRILAAAAGAASPGGVPQLEELFPGGGSAAAFAGHLKKLLDAGLNAEGSTLADQLAGQAKSWALDLAKGSLGALIGNEELVPKFDLSSSFMSGPQAFEKFPSLPSEYKALCGSLGALRFMLASLGQDSAAQAVSQAAATAQSAMQIYQAGQMLLVGATGWGACVGLLGLASGMGGVSLFGGGATEDRQAEVLSLVRDLFRYIVQEFKAVNARLDHIIGALDDLTLQMQEIRLDLAQITFRLAGLEDQAMGLAWLVNRTTYSLSNQIQNAEVTPYESWVANQLVDEDGDMSAGKAIAARMAYQSDQEPPQFAADIVDGEEPVAYEQRASAFLQKAFGYNAPSKMPWVNLDLLGQLLSITCDHALLPQPRRYAPAIYRGIDLYCGLHSVSPSLFTSLDRVVTKIECENLRTALQNHELMMVGLRGQPRKFTKDFDSYEDYLAATPILAELKKSLSATANALWDCMAEFRLNVAYRLLESMKAENAKPNFDPEQRYSNWSFQSHTTLLRGDVPAGLALATTMDGKPVPSLVGVPKEFTAYIGVLPGYQQFDPISVRVTQCQVVSRMVVGWGEEFVAHDVKMTMELIFHGTAIQSFEIQETAKVGRSTAQGKMVDEGKVDPPLYTFFVPEVRDAVIAQLPKLLKEKVTLNACQDQVMQRLLGSGRIQGDVAFALAKSGINVTGEAQILKLCTRVDSLRACLLGVLGLAYPTSFEASEPLRGLLDGDVVERIPGNLALVEWANAFLRLERQPRKVSPEHPLGPPMKVKERADFLAAQDVTKEREVAADGKEVDVFLATELGGFEPLLDRRIEATWSCVVALLESEAELPPPFLLTRAKTMLDELDAALAVG